MKNIQVLVFAITIFLGGIMLSSPAYSFTMSDMGVSLSGQGLEHLVADDSNNVYWISRQGKFAKYTYATGTWGPLTSMGKIIQSVIYKNGAFHGVYISGGYIYYTTTTNPASWPTGIALAPCSSSSYVIININNQGRYAVMYISESMRGVNIASNYSGSNTVYSFPIQYHGSGSEVSNGYNSFLYYFCTDYGDFYCRYDWSGSAWVFTVNQQEFDARHGLQVGNYDGYVD